MGELKKNSGTYYQFSNYANAYIDNDSLTPVYYLALNLGLTKSRVNQLIPNGMNLSSSIQYQGINTMRVASANSALSELLMKYYEAKCGTILSHENGGSTKYFESYLYHTIFEYITSTSLGKVYLDTDIEKESEDIITGKVKIGNTTYTLESDSNRALLRIANNPIKYIGRINCHSTHEFGGRLYRDIHINIPAAHNVLKDVIPVIDTSNETELNRKSVKDMICTAEISNEIPYITALGHNEDNTMIYDVKFQGKAKNTFEYGYVYYRNLESFKLNHDYDGDPYGDKKNLIQNNVKIDFEYLLNNYQEFSSVTAQPQKVEFDTILIMGKDERGTIVPCGVYFCSHYADTKDEELVQIASKTDVSKNGDDGTEYSLRLSTGAQVMQNATTYYENNDYNSDTNNISEMAQLSARLAALSSEMGVLMNRTGGWSEQLSYLIGNAYTIRRNVPYIVDYTIGTKTYKVWYVNGMNTGVTVDGKMLSNLNNSDNEEEIEDELPPVTYSRPYKCDVDECDFTDVVTLTTDSGKKTIKNVPTPKVEVLAEHQIVKIGTIDSTASLTPEYLKLLPYAICKCINDYDWLEPETIYTIYYSIAQHGTTYPMRVDVEFFTDNEDGYVWPVMTSLDHRPSDIDKMIEIN